MQREIDEYMSPVKYFNASFSEMDRSEDQKLMSIYTN